MFFKEKLKKSKVSPNKSNLDQILWFIENYLPQKKIRGVQKKVFMNNLEAGTIKKLSKLASQHSKKFYQTKKNTILSFTLGNWIIPYIKFFKK